MKVVEESFPEIQSYNCYTQLNAILETKNSHSSDEVLLREFNVDDSKIVEKPQKLSCSIRHTFKPSKYSHLRLNAQPWRLKKRALNPSKLISKINIQSHMETGAIFCVVNRSLRLTLVH
ncbi:hypothetical protein RF11_02672 [Thelohanellus kitauei]|uniref:Uncharacterized protein n=1 Tax=Thelohanellus kitauei TaxID=669202 RepID=A0A0C2M9G9_THEKT|nr:hypothetical protein RF11_02672 [Thelohanellus kitauei]